MGEGESVGMREERKSGSERGEIEWGKREEGGKEWREEGEKRRGERERERVVEMEERERLKVFFFIF